MRIFFSKFIDWTILVFLFLLPWQTRLIWQQGEINGAPWEYGTYSIYGTQILLWIIIILFGINKFANRALWKKITTHEHFVSFRKYLFGAVGLIILMIVAVLYSRDIWLSYNYVFNILGALCIFVILSDTKNPLNYDPKGSFATLWMTDGIRMTTALWLGGVVQGILALWQFLSQSVPANKWLGLASHVPQDLGASVIEFGSERWLRAYGSFGSPNSLGIYLAVLLILGTILYLKLKNPWHKILISVGQVIITIGLVLSFSRSAWLATLCGMMSLLIIVVLSSRPSPKGAWRDSLKSVHQGISPLRSASVEMTGMIKQILFILAPVLCLFVIFQPLFLARFNTDNRLEYKSVNERVGQYVDFKKVFFTHPWLGVGPGAYTLALSDMYPKAKAYDLQPVHNIYALVLAEWGIVGTAFWLMVYGFVGLIIWKNNRIFFPILVVLLVVGLFDHWIFTMYTGVMVWWVVWGLGLKKV